MANKLQVELSVDESGRGLATIKQIRDEIVGLEGTTAKALSTQAQAFEQDLVKAGVAAARARVEAEKYQASLKGAATAQTEVGKAAEASGITISRVYRDARKEIEATGKSATQLAEDVRRSQDEAFRERARNSAPAPLRNDAAVRAAQREYVSPAEFGRREAANSSFDNFSTRAAAQQTQREIALARQENLRLQNEVTVSSRLTGQLVSAFIGANIISVAVQEVKDLATAWVDTLKAQEAAHRENLNASIDYGQGIESSVKAVRELADANRNALTAAQATRSYNAGLALASEAGRPEESKELIQRATDLAARRNIPQENVPALLEGIRRGSPGALRELTGQDDIDALNRYASAQHKLVEELNETAKAAARMDAVNRSGAILQGEAERQTRTFAAQMAALKKDFDDSSWILGKADFGIRLGYRGIRDALNPPDPAPDDAELERQAREERTRNVFAGIGQSFARIDERFKASDLLKEQKKAAEAEKQAAEEARQAAEQQRKAIEDVQKATEGLYGFLSSHRGRNNPYVSIFSEAREAAENFESTAERLRKRFGAAADEVISKFEKLTKAKRDALAEDALSQRFDDRLTAQSLQQQIKALNEARPAIEQVKRDVQETATTAVQAVQQTAKAFRDAFTAINPGSPFANRQGTFSQGAFTGADSPFANQQGTFPDGAYIGADSPFAPQKPDTIADVRLRAFVEAQRQGRFIGDARGLAGEFTFSQDEQFRALVKAKDAGTFIGDPAQLFNPRSVSAVSPNISNARDAARLIREIQADAEARGLDPAAAARIADQQIINRIKGGVSAEDLSRNTDLRDLVTGAMGRNADRLLNREDEARGFQADEIKSRRELKQSIDSLNQTIQSRGDNSIRIEVEDKTGGARIDTLGPGFGPKK